MKKYPELLGHQKYYPLQEYIRKQKNKGEFKFEIAISYIENVLNIKMNNTCFVVPGAFWSNGGSETNVQKVVFKKVFISIHGFVKIPYPLKLLLKKELNNSTLWDSASNCVNILNIFVLYFTFLFYINSNRI